MRWRALSRVSRRMAFVFVVAALASGAYAWCRQHVTVSDPDGTTQVCDWYCVVPPNGVISSGCSTTK
jgi:hypothetical protein